jgi:methionine-S-sulfoxide reductase
MHIAQTYGKLYRALTLSALGGLILLAGACGEATGQSEPPLDRPSGGSPEIPLAVSDTRALAIFAGGCFWCMEPPFEKLDGVYDAVSGYTGGRESHPTYEMVSSGQTGHTEAVLVTYDPAKISYAKLLETFWRSINPTQRNGQFADIGTQYRTGIFYLNAEQQKLAEASKRELAASGKFQQPIATEIVAASPFYKAEDYHQDYYKKNPEHYNRYREGSGRAAYLRETWGAR